MDIVSQTSGARPNIGLKILLLTRGITQREAAFGAGVAETDFSTAIRHNKASPELKRKIADFLDVGENEIFPPENKGA